MPIISGGGGSRFNGGTITTALEIDKPAGTPNTPPLVLRGASDQASANDKDLIELYNGDSDFLFAIESTGGIDANLDSAHNAGLTISRLPEQNAVLSVTTTGAANQLSFSNGAGAVIFQLPDGGGVKSAPPVSAAATLALGTAYQNTLGYDVMLCVYLSVTVNTSGVLMLGVGPTTTPTQQTLVTGVTATGLWPVPIYLPDQYYALLSVTGTITVAVDGQIAMPI